MIQLHTRHPENRQKNRFSERRFSGGGGGGVVETVTTGWMGKRGLSANDAQFVSVDLIGKKNQVILEYLIIYTHRQKWSNTTIFGDNVLEIAERNMWVMEIKYFVYYCKFYYFYWHLELNII